MEVVDRLAGQRVLTVDDSRAIRAFLLELLQPHVKSVEVAADASQARAIFGRGGSFDLVLLDILLPDADGIELLRELRAIDPDCAVVMITGAGGVHSATAAVLQGADGFIEKQHLATAGENAQFFYALAQAIEHRLGVVASRRLEAMKADFYSMITHDLRNPAGNVLVALKMLLSGKAGTLEPKQANLAQLAMRSAEKFVTLINDYLDYAKIDAGYLRLDPAEADLAVVVRNAVESASTQAELKRQTITVDVPERIPAFIDATKVEQVMDNLLSNAIKYTPDDGAIGVRVAVNGARAIISVTDTGRGIPRSELGLLFSKYHRVPGQQTSQIQGTGLGLLIIKEIVEAHGGVVHASSEGEPDKGSTFIVELPLRFVPASGPAVNA
jgi:signal transduction histidine kinase